MGYYVNGIHLVTGQLEIEQMPTITGVTPNVYVDSDGIFYKVV